ncbi:hypothetical protein ERO13_D04G123401v2 [Gossypium hirsutum]|nr:hypothetical protein ERO13_D04G123401v2 [Gossypium hirsutum]
MWYLQSARFFNRSNAYYLSLSIKSEPMHNGKRCLGSCTFLTKVAKIICTRQLSSTNKTVELVDSKTNGDLSRSKSESMNADENLLCLTRDAT